MNLGTFSISLAVKNLEASYAFYKKLGFETVDGAAGQKWMVLKNGDAKIGLFEGMFTENLLTFNPSDVRAIQSVLEAQGVTPVKRAAEGAGPAHMVVKDPDGNTLLLDQF